MRPPQPRCADGFVCRHSATSRALLSALLVAGQAAVFPAVAQSTNGTDFASFQIIGQRNIFDPNRVPHRPFTAPPAPKVVDSFAFVGTMSYAKGNFAFFDGTSPDFRKVLELDGAIAGFKVAAIAPKSVTLLSDTNETVLKLGMQMHRDDADHWVVSTEPVSYASGSSSHASGSERRFSSRRRYNGSGSGRNNFQTASMTAAGTGAGANAANASPLPGGGANDALTRLMQRRAEEEQQLGSGQ